MKTVVQQIWEMINKDNRRRLVVVLIITIISTLFEMIGVSLIVPVVTALTSSYTIDSATYIGRICIMLNIKDNAALVQFSLIALIVIYILKNLVYVLNNYLQTNLVCDCRRDVQKRLLHSFLERNYEYYFKITSGEVVRIIYSDTTQTFYILRALITLVSELFVSLGLVVVILFIDWQMTLFVAVLMILASFFVAFIIKPSLKREGTAFQNSCTLVYNWIIQVVDGIKMIKVSGKGAAFEHIFQNNVRKKDYSEEHYVLYTSIPRLMIETFGICSVLGYLLVKTLLGVEIASLLPALSAFAMAAVKLMPGTNKVVSAIGDMTYNRPSVQQVYDNVFFETIYEEKRRQVKRVDSFNRSIELKDITFSYPGTNKYVFENANFAIDKGSVIGIMGPSGSGKTTMVDILLGILAPQKGIIAVDGVEENLQEKQLVFSVGYIPQSIFLLDDSIKANIAFGVDPGEIDLKRIDEVIKEAQLESYVASLPNGIDTTIGEKGIRLSGGQRQRIGIARALYHNPELLIFDEATSALDNETEEAVMEAIDILKGLKTMIIIAHRLNTLSNCDCVYKVENAEIKREK